MAAAAAYRSGCNSITQYRRRDQVHPGEIAQRCTPSTPRHFRAAPFFVAGRGRERRSSPQRGAVRAGRKNLVIADPARPLLRGRPASGAATRASRYPRRVALESANFHAPNIRKTSAKSSCARHASVSLRTWEGSGNTLRDLARAVELSEQVSRASYCGAWWIAARRCLRPRDSCDAEWPLKKLGPSDRGSRVA